MNMIAVDDERPALRALERALKSTQKDALIACFLSAQDALEYARENTVDVAFLDIEMSEINGLSLAKKLKDIYGETNIIFVTGHKDYSYDALQLKASGYIMKPINANHVEAELESLRHPIRTPDKGIYIQCFGNFEVFVDGKPVLFKRSKSKEALAYLVDRKGGGVSKKELAGILWEDEPYTRSKQIQFHTIIAETTRALDEAGADGVVIKSSNLYAVDTAKFYCDYYGYEKGNMRSVNSYRGEYMANYSWAEFTAGFLADGNKK